MKEGVRGLEAALPLSQATGSQPRARPAVRYLVPLLLDAGLQGHQLLLQLVHRLLLLLQQRPLCLPLPLQQRPLHFSLRATPRSTSEPVKAGGRRPLWGPSLRGAKSTAGALPAHLSGRLLQLLLQLLHADLELLHAPQHLSALLFQGQHLPLQLGARCVLMLQGRDTVSRGSLEPSTPRLGEGSPFLRALRRGGLH